MPSTVLIVRHLTKRFGELTAVSDLSLDIEMGEIFGFLGPNGAGKTTAIRMMVGLLKPTSGEVIFDGLALGSGHSDQRARVGVCPQETILWEKLTCLEQLEFMGEMYGIGRVEARQRGCRLLADLGLEAKGNELAGHLSGGMKRRLNIALALVHDPPILVLDEPEAGLDPQSRALVRDMIRGLARRKTVILTTHDMDEADRIADRVAIIDHGQLLVLDTPENLKHSIGEGDVVEVLFRNDPGERAVQAARTVFEDSIFAFGVLTARGACAGERLPALLDALRSAGLVIGDVHLRTSTLEDVFLSLTGRRLRE